MSPFDRIDFKSLIAKEKNGRMRVRLMALSHINKVLIIHKPQETSILAVVLLMIGLTGFMLKDSKD